MKNTFHLKLAALCAVLLQPFSPSVLQPFSSAASKYWVDSDDSWTTGTWFNSTAATATTTLPTASDTAYIVSGRVTIDAGSSGTATQIRLGSSTGSSGTVAVLGSLFSTQYVTIGNGAGDRSVVDVAATGTVTTSTQVSIGEIAGSSGTATVAGLWLVTGSTYVGRNGTGFLDVKEGGAYSGAGNISIGLNAGRSGAASVSGLLSTARTLYVGEQGFGFLNIAGTGTVTSGVSAAIGYGANATGTVTVAGLWQNTGTLTVGGAGAGYLYIAPGGTVTTTGYTWLGASSAASSGTVSVAGYFRSNQSLYVGAAGAGTFEVTGAGYASVSAAAIGGHPAGATTGSGALLVSGTGVFATGYLYVGRYGTGELNITDFGSVTTTNLFIGDSGGAGTLNIGASGTLISTSADTRIGTGAGVSGTLAVAGYFENRAIISIGYNGDGTLDIMAGGTVRNTGNAAYLAYGGTGAATVAGHWAVSNTLVIGRAGAGSLTINGGTVSAGVTTLAANAGSTGTLAMNGGLLETASLSSGAGAAAFVFNNGTIASTADSANFFALPTLDIGAGDLALDTRAFSLTATNAFAGSGLLAKTGAGDLVLTGVSPAFSGTLDIRSGALVVGAGARLGGSANIGPGATLRGASAAGSGTLGHLTLAAAATLDLRAAPLAASGNVTFADGAILSLLLDSPQTLTIGGTLAFNGAGTLLIDRGSLDLADLAGTSYTLATFSDITGAAHLANWNLSVPDFTLDATLSTATPGALILYISNASIDQLIWNTGPGVWDDSAQNWRRAAASGIDVAWSAGALAIFSDPPAGVVTVTGSQSIIGLRFDTDGYTLAGAGTLASTTAPAINVTDASVTATISAALKTAGLAKNGPGTLVLAGADTNITGSTTVNAGLLSVTGTIATADAFVGTGAAPASATVSGLWQITGALAVGDQGTGSLEITPGGTGTATGIITIGKTASGTGAVSVSDSGYLVGRSSLYVGEYGIGTLDIAAGGTVANAAAAIGRYANSTGTATVSGLWRSSAQLYVGYEGDGVLDITPTGTVTVSNVTYIANGADTTGTVNVSGLMQLSQALVVGGSGIGVVNILAGGTVSNLSTNNTSIGRYVGGTGVTNVAGLMQLRHRLYVGNEGSGTLAITGAGAVTVGENYIQNALSTLAVELQPDRADPAVAVAGRATLAGTLSVGNFALFSAAASGTRASELTTPENTALIIRADGGFTGDFAGIDAPDDNPAARPGYIAPVVTITGGTDLRVGYGLAWNAAGAAATGAFDVAAGTTFEVDVNTGTRAAAAIAGSGWDGATLAKLGGGALILSASHAVGATAADAGILSVTGTLASGVTSYVGRAAGSSGTAIISGLWQVTGTLSVGEQGSGWLEITPDGKVTNTNYGVLGAATGASGIAQVDGLWSVGSSILVGGSGAGHLQIGATGTLTTAGAGAIGRYAGSSGTATVSGLWQDTGYLYVGYAGDGILDIKSTGTVVNLNNYGAIGHSAGGTGTAFVAGVWALNNNTLYVGNTGTGFLDIADTGAVTNNIGIIGNNTTASGSAIVSGLWASTGSFYIGNSGTGWLEVKPGGTGTAAGIITIGKTASGAGAVSVSGSGLLATPNALYVGELGSGRLDIADTGTVIAGAGAFIGRNAGSTGAATVSGLWQVTGTLSVGEQGSGWLEITPTGTVTNTTFGIIGGGTGGAGSVRVDGYWSVGSSLYVGGSGAGYLQIGGTGALDGTGTLTTAAAAIGRYARSTGTAVVAAGEWNLGNSLYVGYEGAGVLDILAGGTVANTTSAANYIGQSANGTGTANVAGVWTMRNTLVIGNSGVGVLDVAATGTVTNNIGAIGYGAGSGAAFVSGVWASSGSLYVGNNGSGYLEIRPGGTGTASGVITIGKTAGVSGAVSVSGSGYLVTRSSLYVGEYGIGALDIAATGSVANNAGAIGRYAGSSGAATVAGLWQNSGQLYVGYAGDGTLDITPTGTVIVGNVIYIANGVSTTGTVNVAGLLQLSQAIVVGGTGVGTLNIFAGGTVSNLSTNNTSIGRYVGGTGITNVAGLMQLNHRLYVGNEGSGTLAITGAGAVTAGENYIQNALSTLAVELQPGRTDPAVTVGGRAALDGALVITNYDGGIPTSFAKASELSAPENTALIIRSAGGFTGDFATFSADATAVPGADYLVPAGGITADGAEYRVGYGLAWNASPAAASGAFTIPDGATFDVDTPLVDRAGAFLSGWDGRSLTKSGGGTLILSAANTFTGAATVESGTLSLNGGATMRLGALINHATVDFGGPSNAVPSAPAGVTVSPAPDGFRTLTVDSLAGAGDFRMKVDIAAGKNDRLAVLGDASGAHRLLLVPVGAPETAPNGDESLLTLVSIGGRDQTTGFTTTGTFAGGFDSGPFNYALEQRGNDIVIVNHGFSEAIAPVRGVPGAQSVLWFGQQDNLVKRFGEIRASDGEIGDRWLGNRWMLWARARASQADLDTGAGIRASKLTLWGAEIGADKTWRLADERVTLGFFAGYGSGSQDFRAIANGGAKGSSDLLGAGLYAAWFSDRGWFVNATLSAARYKNDFRATDESGNRTEGAHNDSAYGASIEAGNRIALDFISGACSGWFAEPAAQVSRVRLDRSDYATTGASRFNIHNVDATVTRLRATLRAGRAWRPGLHGQHGFLELAGRLAFTRESSTGGEVYVGGAAPWRPNLDGNRAEAGASAIWRPRVDDQFHLDYEASYGDHYQKPWEISLSYRHLF